MTARPPTRALRSGAFTVGLFYLLIALEFFYMATPFAVYFYGAYMPGLTLLNRVPQLSWLSSFFLPHFAVTSSAAVNAAPIAGALLTALGLLGFLFGAIQVYGRKLLRRGAATGGVYRLVRHPQYASLILAGTGMLFLWPRFLMLAFFVAMLFAYRGLAAIEEQECIRIYGRAYLDYAQRTPRFWPLRFSFRRGGPERSRAWPIRLAAGLAGYAALSALALGAGHVVQGYTLRHLFSRESAGGLYLSLVPADSARLGRAADLARADERVRALLTTAGFEQEPMVNYVMPWEWAIPELPMNEVSEHRAPAGYDPRRLKIVFTRAVLRPGAVGRDLLRSTVRLDPLGEAWIDEEGRVARVLGPPKRTFYGTVPVPVF